MGQATKRPIEYLIRDQAARKLECKRGVPYMAKYLWQRGLAVSRYKIWELGRTLCPGVNNMSLYVIFGHNTKPSHFCRAGLRPDGKVGTDKWTLHVIQSKSVIWPSDPRPTIGER